MSAVTLCSCGRPAREGKKKCTACAESARKRSANRYHELLGKGLCVSCGKAAPVPGRVRCAPCLEKSGQASKQSKETYRQEGRCFNCGRPVDSGIHVCEWCRTESNRSSREKYWLCACAGICVKCQCADATHGRFCDACWAKKVERESRKKLSPEQCARGSEARKETYHQLKADGLCTRCKKPVDTKGRALCPGCRAEARERNRKKYGPTFAELGLCTFCGGERVEGYKLCEACLEKSRSRLEAARRENSVIHPWKKLNDLTFGNGGDN